MNFALAIPIVAGGIRNIAGWVENSLKDGKIQRYEWTKLLATMTETIILAVASVYGLGLDMSQASGLAVLASFGISALKKAGTK